MQFEHAADNGELRRLEERIVADTQRRCREAERSRGGGNPGIGHSDSYRCFITGTISQTGNGSEAEMNSCFRNSDVSYGIARFGGNNHLQSTRILRFQLTQ
jgi:hypothetical protein